VISARQRDRVLTYSRFGHEDGARLVTGGVAAKVVGHENGYFVEPTVFADVKSDMRIFQEEVFGPFTSVTPFKDEAEALRLANDSPFGLAAAIRTPGVGSPAPARAAAPTASLPASRPASSGSTTITGSIRPRPGVASTIPASGANSAPR